MRKRKCLWCEPWPAVGWILRHLLTGSKWSKSRAQICSHDTAHLAQYVWIHLKLTLNPLFYLGYLTNAFYFGGGEQKCSFDPIPKSNIWKYKIWLTGWYSPKFFRKIGFELMLMSSLWREHCHIFEIWCHFAMTSQAVQILYPSFF